MSREEKKHVISSPNNFIILLILLTAASLINFKFNASFALLLLYSIGSFIYVIYITINTIGYRYNCDYIQSGEASAALLAIIVVSSWLSEKLYLLFPAVILIVFLSDIFVNRVLIKKGTEAITAGMYINIFTAVLLVFIAYKIPDFDSSLIYQVLFGYITAIDHGQLYLVIPTALAALSILLYFILKPELVLFSHGPTYFRLTGMNYTRLRVIITLFRSLVFTTAFFLVGVAGGAALYFHRSAKGKLYRLEFIMMTLIYAQVIVMISLYFGKKPASLFSIAISYILYLLLKKKRIYLYDRN